MKAFDKFSDYIADRVANAWFFMGCVLLILIWIPTLFILDLNLSQLLINTATTIITFLLVALLHNSQHRFENATNARLQELIEAVQGITDPVDDEGQKPLKEK